MIIMYCDVKKISVLNDYGLFIELENGETGVFDIKPYIETGVFQELRDEYYFSQVYVEYGALTWPHEQDIAPERLYKEMVRTEISNSKLVI